MLYDRSTPARIEVVDRWDTGIGWMAHSDEATQRTSHAIKGADGVWVFDPLDGPGIADRIDDLGSVAGVAVLSNYHSRDATVFAERHGVPVHLPTWMDNAAEHVDAQIARYDAPAGQWVELGESGIEIRTVDPTTAWREAIAYLPTERSLRVADMLSTNSFYTVGDERLGCYFFHRFAPPRAAFADV